VPVVMPTTWHLTIGWRRYGPISPDERPGPLAEPAPRRRARATGVGRG